MSCINCDCKGDRIKKYVYILCGFVLFLVACCLLLAEYGRMED